MPTEQDPLTALPASHKPHLAHCEKQRDVSTLHDARPWLSVEAGVRSLKQGRRSSAKLEWNRQKWIALSQSNESYAHPMILMVTHG